jgi:hypothetical protein
VLLIVRLSVDEDGPTNEGELAPRKKPAILMRTHSIEIMMPLIFPGVWFK